MEKQKSPEQSRQERIFHQVGLIKRCLNSVPLADGIIKIVTGKEQDSIPYLVEKLQRKSEALEYRSKHANERKFGIIPVKPLAPEESEQFEATRIVLDSLFPLTTTA